MAVNLTHQSYIPFNIAVEKYGIAPAVLRERIASGTIEAIKTSTGVEIVAEHDLDVRYSITKEQFEHFRGISISVSEAADEYGIPATTITRWGYKGYIKVLESSSGGRGNATVYDKADMAYCAAVYKAVSEERDGNMRGVRLFDEDGNPYQIKNPEEAAKKRQQRRED